MSERGDHLVGMNCCCFYGWLKIETTNIIMCGFSFSGLSGVCRQPVQINNRLTDADAIRTSEHLHLHRQGWVILDTNCPYPDPLIYNRMHVSTRKCVQPWHLSACHWYVQATGHTCVEILWILVVHGPLRLCEPTQSHNQRSQIFSFPLVQVELLRRVPLWPIDFWW